MDFNIKEIKRDLDNNGWCIIPNVLTNEEVQEAKKTVLYLAKNNSQSR